MQKGQVWEVDINICVCGGFHRLDERDLAVFTVDGVSVPTVSIANLIESKRTGRLQDLADIQLLEELLQRETDR